MFATRRIRLFNVRVIFCQVNPVYSRTLKTQLYATRILSTAVFECAFSQPDKVGQGNEQSPPRSTLDWDLSLGHSRQHGVIGYVMLPSNYCGENCGLSQYSKLPQGPFRRWIPRWRPSPENPGTKCILRNLWITFFNWRKALLQTRLQNKCLLLGLHLNCI